MSTRVTSYNPEILQWAVQRANSDVDEVSKRFTKFGQWLDKSYVPTFKQLEDFAKSVYVPFGYLFLPHPPEEELPLTFFRANPDAPENGSLNLYQSIQIIKDRQDWLRDFRKDNGAENLAFVGKFSQDSHPLEIVSDIHKVLNIPYLWSRELASQDRTLGYLIEKIEAANIMTGLSGTVNGNTHRPISREDFRGFVLVDPIAPFIFVNTNDSTAAQIFTLVHELAHIWIGVSAGTDMYKLLPANHPVEKLCDKVAAEFLVPHQAFMEQWQVTQNFNVLRSYFKVSSLVIARRALDFELISRERYFQLYKEVMEYWLAKKETDKDNDAGGGHFYYTARRRVGAQFARYVDSAVKQDKLLYRDAYAILNLKGDTYNRFTNEFI